MLSFALLRQTQGEATPYVMALRAALFLLPGPLQTLYLLRLTRSDPLPRLSFLLILPFFLGLTMYSAIATGWFPDTRMVARDGFAATATTMPGLWAAFGAVITIAHLAYPIVGLRALADARTRLKAIWSSYLEVNVIWLRNWLWASILLIALGSGVVVFGSAVRFSQMAAAIQFALAAQIIWFVFHGLRQTSLFRSEFVGRGATRTAQEELAEIVRLIDLAMTREQLFRKPRLSVSDLADAVGRPVSDVSTSIRAILDTTFFDYVNALRVSHVQHQLRQAGETNINLLTLALDSGFNSKSAFNAAFKQHTGQTPSEFRRTLKS